MNKIYNLKSCSFHRLKNNNIYGYILFSSVHKLAACCLTQKPFCPSQNKITFQKKLGCKGIAIFLTLRKVKIKLFIIIK